MMKQSVNFHERRRQQFLSESNYQRSLEEIPKGIDLFESTPAGSGSSEAEGWLISYRMAAFDLFNLLVLRHTGGGSPSNPCAPSWKTSWWRTNGPSSNFVCTTKYPNAIGLQIDSFDGYCPCLGLISLCFLLHRRDLLPRIAELLDGPDKTNVGADFLIEDFLSYAPMDRYESDTLLATRPFESLADAMDSTDNEDALRHLQKFLKRWYKDLAGAPWHNAHKPDAEGRTGGYYGYWSFEAAAAVLLLDIEDDSSLHPYLYHPRDLVAWARTHSNLEDGPNMATATTLRCDAGQPCPKAGYWMTPAKSGSRRYFLQGETKPGASSDYGSTIWQWDIDEADPKL
ncbi:PoNe immunity protein domain-containing protein [Cupriavidus alkaliphilus]|uniref:PoNi C-terminal domain-containing protein n=1 Tax=Cupriavidus alkaliphilus TaxID=942866 RepID=A0A7W4YT56_9BURK|nr:PoNe immunity protein domain-containing protein [Cupriavidus alkaliphilus]MBB3009147.1 hypothetical protein [Cupriavidus alkaliphilus]SCB22636.1 protein of unknown function [Cupriavidus alkaliphilus]